MDSQAPYGSTPSPELVVPTVVHEPPRVAPRTRARGFGCLATGLGICLLLSVLFNLALISSHESSSSSDTTIKEKFYSLSTHGKNKVAIIEVTGSIMDGEDTQKVIDHVRNDKGVKAVVLRVDSPGGTVFGSDFIYHELTELLKKREIPMVVSMGGVAASGGYYISMAVGHKPDTIFAEPTTWTGSIGVIIPHYDLSGFLADYKVQDDSIKSAPLKAIGSLTKPMTEEERKVLQGLVDSGFSRFKDIVKSGRQQFAEHPDKLDAVTTGQVFDAPDAKEKGLVDRIGYLDDAIVRAMELAGIDKENTKAVKYHKQFGLLEHFLFGSQRVNPSFDLTSLLDLTVPRAYYMWTSLPPVDALSRPKRR